MSPDERVGTAEEAQIRRLIEQRVEAVHAKQAAVITGQMSSRAVLYDAMGPLQQVGVEAESKRLEEWLASYRGQIGYEIRNLDITADGDVGFCHLLYRVSGTTTAGTNIDMWLRATLGLRKLDGNWTIVHEHNSVPFDATGAASMDLKP
jgi:ketosteroid isomerase-like protein